MPSSTQRSRKFRDRLKEDEEKLEVYWRKDRERTKEYIKTKSTSSTEEKLKIRATKTTRQRQWRAK